MKVYQTNINGNSSEILKFLEDCLLHWQKECKVKPVVSDTKIGISTWRTLSPSPLVRLVDLRGLFSVDVLGIRFSFSPDWSVDPDFLEIVLENI